VSEEALPDAKFRCLICGEIRDNRTYVRYLHPEECRRTARELLEITFMYPCACEPESYVRRVEILMSLEPDAEVYEFTVCHGLFVKVEGGERE